MLDLIDFVVGCNLFFSCCFFSYAKDVRCYVNTNECLIKQFLKCSKLVSYSLRNG